MKLLPSNIEAETGLIASILLNNKKMDLILESIKPNMFYNQSNKAIFEAIIEMYSENIIIEYISLIEKLREKKTLTKIGGESRITEISESQASAENVSGYIKIILEKYQQRELMRICSETYNEASERKIDELLSEVETELMNLSIQKSHQIKSIKEALLEYCDYIDEKNLPKRKSIKTGIQDLNDLITNDGFTAGQLVIIAGRPSTGKTSLAIQIMRHCSIIQNIPCVLFSLETSVNSITARIVAQEARVNVKHLALMNPQENAKFQEAIPRISNSKIFIDDMGSVDMNYIKAKSKMMKAKHDIGLVLIDYIQLMISEGSTRDEEIGNITRGLKILSKELNVPIIALSQLNRGSEINKQKPCLANLRGSGNIEQDADLVIFTYMEDPTNKMNAEILLRKQKDGPVGDLPVDFISEFALFQPKPKEKKETLPY
ncbi:DnaB-like helicase C-terminal domain-containing protein [Neomegalonema sp.]|uniref:replicative DNA helicase n=1 Tax=Neomegalonema sp. TaxID=2039713 RepID=UPI002633FEE1|nr:DnaB-like helicase C-terminal domain-containing protein [Neomegalonema sp.]MDD2869627.1 DnaB-like helicase C-terminal domain-containing protein [Neomegalonema sp.]